MTPKARDADFSRPTNPGRPKEMSTHLGTQVVYNPPLLHPGARMPFGTPTAGMGDKDATPTEGMAHRWLVENKGGNLLETVAAQMYPTPMAHEVRLGYQDRSRGKKGTQESLTTVVFNEQGTTPKASGHKLNPAFVTRLMGFPDHWLELGE